MTSQQHPLTPPPELVKQWIGDYYGCPVSGELAGVETAIAARAAQWGADQELEACCEWLRQGWDDVRADKLRATRRPKPPSLAEEALETVQKISKNGYPCNYQDDADWDTIRRALEKLQQLENQQ